MTSPEQKQSPEAKAKMISLLLETALSLLSDPIIRETILLGIREGKKDIDIAKLIAPSQDPHWIASALKTARWKEHIPGRPPEVDRENSRNTWRQWISDHPEEHAANRKNMIQAALQRTAGVPVIYTEEIRSIIGDVFLHGGTYAMAAQVLSALGHEDVTARKIEQAARRWGIPYLAPGNSEIQSQLLKEEVLRLAEQGLSIAEIRQQLSHVAPARIHDILAEHKIRTQRINWQLTIGGETLQQLAVDCYLSEGSYKLGCLKFNSKLQESDFPPVSAHVYGRAVRRKLAK